MNTQVDEDTNANSLFKALNVFHKHLLPVIEKECDLFCIPLNRSLKHVTITEDFIEAHIFKKSSYFKSHYHSVKSNKTIEIDESGYALTKTGYPEYLKVRIRSEEVAYTKIFRPYKIFWVDQPLVRTHCLDVSTNALTSSFKQIDLLSTPKTNYTESVVFLEAFQEHVPILKQLRDDIRQFRSSYVFLPGYVTDAANRIKNIIHHTTEKLMNVNSLSSSDSGIADNICQCTETYVIGQLYSYIYPVICERFRVEDERIIKKLHLLKHCSVDELGCKSHLKCSVLPAVVELCSLNMYKTPVEKLTCLKRTVDELIDSISSHLTRATDGGGQESCAANPCHVMSSDELLLLLVPVICQAKLQNPLSNLFFIENFRWFSSNKDEFGYILVTFSAVLEYIQNLIIDESDDHSHVKATNFTTPSEIDRIHNNFQRAVEEMSRMPCNSKLADIVRSDQVLKKVPPPDVVPRVEDKQQSIKNLINVMERSVMKSLNKFYGASSDLK